MARLMILVEHPRHVASEEVEAWLRPELRAFEGDGVDEVTLRRLTSPADRYAQSWSWLIELDCRDEESASRAVREGSGLALIADLRMLGLHPSVALVEDAS